jgi:hypothetical protein
MDHSSQTPLPKQAKPTTATPKDNKINQNACTKIASVVQRVLLPLIDAPMEHRVSFRITDQPDINDTYLKHLTENDPESMRDESAFIQKMSGIYKDSRR